jgi:hypothetical protein
LVNTHQDIFHLMFHGRFHLGSDLVGRGLCYFTALFLASVLYWMVLSQVLISSCLTSIGEERKATWTFIFSWSSFVSYWLAFILASIFSYMAVTTFRQAFISSSQTSILPQFY